MVTNRTWTMLAGGYRFCESPGIEAGEALFVPDEHPLTAIDDESALSLFKIRILSDSNTDRWQLSYADAFSLILPLLCAEN